MIMMNKTPQPNQQAWRLLVLLLRKIATHKDISEYKIAKETGIHQPNVNRFFNSDSIPRLDTFLKISNAVGVNFFIENTDNSDIDFNQLINQAMDELGRRPDNLPEN